MLLKKSLVKVKDPMDWPISLFKHARTEHYRVVMYSSRHVCCSDAKGIPASSISYTSGTHSACFFYVLHFRNSLRAYCPHSSQTQTRIPVCSLIPLPSLPSPDSMMQHLQTSLMSEPRKTSFCMPKCS